MKKIIPLLILLFSLSSYAQGEANIWYFGHKSGLNFNSGSPIALSDGQIDTVEGCATISNAAGQLLFYTDGMTVFGKNHQIMPNGKGLLGDGDSTQAAIIVPKPNSTTIYYIFTSTYSGHSPGIRYSEVDMSLNNGFGAVTTTKNVLLVTPACEKLTAVQNTAKDGYWVVTHAFGNDSFYAFSVNQSGVNTTAVISSVGFYLNPLKMTNAWGAMKISPDGSKLISCNYDGNTELYDFNASTGSITNPRLICNLQSNNLNANYGVEFSPSGNIAYITTGNITTGFTNGLYQFDLTSSNIPNSAIEIYKGPPNYYRPLGSLQLGPNGKIYMNIIEFYSLSVINNPEVLGIGCGFQMNAIPLVTGMSKLGLPQFVQSLFKVGITTQNNCLGDSASFSLSGVQSITSINWSFGDGNSSTDTNPTHTYATAGNYTVTVSVNGAVAKTKDIVIATVPTANPPQDLLVCDDNNDGLYHFDLTQQNIAILNGQDPNLYTIRYYTNNVAIVTPNTFTNALPYQQQTIIAEVSNKANGECKSTTTFNIDVFDTPKPNPTIPNLISCDNTSVGTDTDGLVIFDLTQRATSALNGQSASQFQLSYYKDVTLTQPILSPTAYQNTNPTETIYIKMVNKDNLVCLVVTSFTIQILALPSITNVVYLKQCDDDIDGFSVFNLEESITKITANTTTETITFFKTLLEAQNNVNPISNATAYTNQTVSNDIVYARVINGNGCFKIAQLNLNVSTTQIPMNFTRSFTQCDDSILGTNSDGIASFDFSNVTNQIQNVFPVGQQLDITYYRNLTDALAEKNAISDISNYRNIGYPNTQKIYIRVDSRINNDCLGLGNHITLTVEPAPIVQSIKQNHCDDNQDGQYPFDTSAIQTNLLNGLTNVTVSYFDQNNNSLPSPLPNPFLTSSQTLKVAITNNTPTACSYYTTIAFIVDDLPEAFPISASATTVCDDETDPTLQDGKYAFDTSSFQATILGKQTGMTVNYFDENNNPLSSPLPNPFTTATQQVKVVVINPINNTCTATTIIPFTVNPVPAIHLAGDELVCSNLPTFTKTIDAALLDTNTIPNYNYSWFLNGNLIPNETNYSLTVNTKGIYTVTVSNNQGCSRSRKLTVSASDIAKIAKVDIVDLEDSNSITISAIGAGDYVYGLDNKNSPYQSENTFANVNAGIHTIFVKDQNGCGIISKEVALLGIPNYFTPNQDGYNDTWNLKGVNTVTNSKTTIQIFDRYGKLIKEISPIGEGWDGTYIGLQMPASDYWYSIQLEDGRILKGHFALNR
jgi:gliding motility-associated-like protein